ncbi:MAG: hypothetical protein KF864_02015 [Phycisphaeraceae bacterium]|nr:hypothetical protein [Phycisphaeraceae bacterium]MBX3409830.1 hypothetical protein [Phycisphaeraceae bacterium]
MKTTTVSAALSALSLCLCPAMGQTIAPEFASDYSFTDLGSASNVPASYGGLFIRPSEPNTLYLAGSANTGNGALYAVPLSRDVDGRITGFAGPGTRVADAPNNDGGIVLDPGGLVSFARYPTNAYGQIDLATGLVVNNIDLTAFGVAASSSSVNFIPANYPGAGGMRIASWSGGQYYEIDYSVGAGGIISIHGATQVVGSTLPGGPEGFAYVPLGSAQFANPSMIVSEYSAGSVAVYEMDSNGNPIIASRRLFMSGLTGAEGAAIDPVTGAFLFSTFGGGNRVVVVDGFEVPAPGALALAAGAGLVALRRRR